MEQSITNHSSTPVDAASESLDHGTRGDFLIAGLELLLVPLSLVGIAGNVMLFRVAHFMVDTNNKPGKCHSPLPDWIADAGELALGVDMGAPQDSRRGYVLLRLVAATDTVGVIVLGAFTLLSLFSPVNQDNNDALCKVFYGGICSCLYGGNFLMAAMSLERLYAAFNQVDHRDKVTKGMMTKVGTGCLLYAVVINLGVTASPLFDNSHGVCFLVNEDLGEAIREVAVAGVLSHFFVVPSVVILACALAAVIKLALRQNSSRL